jgi:hypothetical protein
VLISSAAVARLGSSSPRLSFGEEPKPAGAWAGRRLLCLDEKPAFELSFWCGTCQFLFRRLEGADETLSLAVVRQRLTDGLSSVDDDVCAAFGELLPEGDYLPMLLEVVPRLTWPMKDGDYFAEEQVATWGLSTFWGLPEYPSTPYYRTFQTRVDERAHLFEFVVPMMPPSWNDPDTVAEHAHRLTTSSTPTAVAVSILDVCQPATEGQGPDCYQHWGLTHFLLDGHHKIQAAANTGRPLRLLSLVAIGNSLAATDEVTALPRLLAQSPAPRGQPRRGGDGPSRPRSDARFCRIVVG